MSEEIIGIINKCITKTGRHVDIFLTTNRIIVAKYGNYLASTLAFGIVGSAISNRSAKKKSEELRKLSADSILNADDKNYDIPYSEITKVKMNKPGMLKGGRIEIVAISKEHVFGMLDKN